MKKHAGRPGAKSNGWEKIGFVGRFGGVGWEAYRKPTNEHGWLYVKVVADEPVENKANYWLSWNGERFAKTGDFVKMAEHRSGLVDMCNNFMACY